MKTIITGILLTIFSINTYGQSFQSLFFGRDVYRTKIDLTATRILDKDVKQISNETYTLKVSKHGHLDYKLLKENDNGYVIIRVLPKAKLVIEPAPNDSSKTVNVIRYSADKRHKNDTSNVYDDYFAIKQSDFKPLAKTILPTKFIGVALLHPFKVRPNQIPDGWMIKPEFALTYSIGFRFNLGKNPYSQNFISILPYGFGIGVASHKDAKFIGGAISRNNAIALTYYQGGILFTLKKIHIGAFVGFDAMLGKKKNWANQGKPYLSLGIGYKLRSN